MYWGAYHNGKEIKTIQIRGNLLLQVPEFLFKLVLLGLCLGLASQLDVPRPDKYFGWPPKNLPVDLVIGIVVGLVVQFLANMLAAIAIRIWGPGIYSPIVMRSVVPKNTREWVLIMLPLLLAVMVEEVLFRALTIGGFTILVNPWLLAVASSVLFGMVHAPQGSLGMVLTGLVGFVFAAIFIITNSLLAAITAHFVINLLQIIRARSEDEFVKRFAASADTVTEKA
jgi:membrane protease YdiL (CAAX protease family)